MKIWFRCDQMYMFHQSLKRQIIFISYLKEQENTHILEGSQKLHSSENNTLPLI